MKIPIDLVYLWCDTADPVFRANRNKYAAQFGVPLNDDSNGEARGKSNDELKYSLRSAELYVPWVRKVFICINDDQQPPSWLNLKNPKLRIVRLSEFIPQEFLPTFNSMTIEHFLWRIPDLAEHFLFACDDMMFGRPLSKNFFFAEDAKPYCRFRRLMPPVNADSSGYRKWLENAVSLMRSRHAELNDDVKAAMLRWPHHNIDAYVKSDLAKVYGFYREQIEATLHNPFRAEDNIQRVLFEYYGIQSLGWHYRQVEEVNLETIEAHSYWNLAVAINSDSRPGLFCFNDNENLSDYERMRGMRLISNLLLPEPSSFEKEGTAREPVSKAEREAIKKELKRYCETNTRDNYTRASRMTLVRLRNHRVAPSEHPAVSIIIPVYNGEKYLNECLASVFSDAGSMDVEVICVDDGSADDSLELLQDWAKVAPNLRIIRQMNKGPGVARNAGMDVAKGEYICFLDVDDRIAPGDALLRAYEQAKRDCLDMLLAAASTIAEDGKILRTDVYLNREFVPDVQVFSPDALGVALFLCAPLGPWGKLYRRAFLEKNKLRFPALKRSEDFPMVGLALALSSRIGVFAQSIYERRIGVVSSLESTKDETPLIFFEAEQIFRDFLRERNLWSRFKAAVYSAFVSRLAYNLREVRRYSSFRAIIAKYRQEQQHWICWEQVALPERFAKNLQLVNDITKDMDDDDQIAVFVELRVAAAKNASENQKLCYDQKRLATLVATVENVRAARDDALRMRDNALATLDRVKKGRDDALRMRDNALATLDGVKKGRDDALRMRDNALATLESVKKGRDDALRMRDNALATLDGVKKGRDDALRMRDNALATLESVKKGRDDALRMRDNALATLESVKKGRDDALRMRDNALATLDGVKKGRDDALRMRDNALATLESVKKGRDDALRMRDNALATLESVKKGRDDALRMRDNAIATLESVKKGRDDALRMRDNALATLKNVKKGRDDALRMRDMAMLTLEKVKNDRQQVCNALEATKKAMRNVMRTRDVAVRERDTTRRMLSNSSVELNQALETLRKINDAADIKGMNG